ncbi:MOSC domain-containing protein YiiM [Thalassospira sp. MBR-102]|uniref:MOSC domain-containing protein n=1 Tax=Thalassospira xiamenensis M-5 = DSM 17429 TaxID=1123366 RepID=A0AB72U8H2_9PROT|nr:MOSC domain-containing protein [Thalassospira xiamenensis]AJD50506.1 MOSC domain-containing protein [Thalassospira xiamenensis M-5 = DSM 17429]SIS77669.1 MOSC domain-containing protein [Thalassospira xiamenensis M-5 = DSM 17429]
MTATLIGIARKARSRAPMETLDGVSVSLDFGVDGDYRGKLRKRQITVMTEEDWLAACGEIDRMDLPWTTRRANLLVRGVKLPQTPGTRIRIGELVLEITGETDPCNRMEAAAPGLEKALTPDWRGGVTCRAIEPGAIRVGDTVIVD